jgi:hypothetical protein
LENAMGLIERATATGAGLLIGCLLGAAAVQADHRPVIAVPGNAQVPVIIDGVDASYAVVVGEWGLHAPGRIAPKIIPPPVVFYPGYGPVDPAYYPATGRRPRYGRQEVEIGHASPRPAQSFHREWSAQSGAGPVTEYPPFEPPSVVVEPRRRHRQFGRRPQ